MLWYLIPVFFTLIILFSFSNIRHGKGLAQFIYSWGFPFGAFVWEDLFIFSLYGLIASIVTLITGQYRIGLLFFVIFWVVRSLGETIYFFLQQFIEPKHYPHFIDQHFKFLRQIFGQISYQQCLIIMQVFFQIILMSSLSGLIFLIISWNSLAPIN